MLKQNKIQAHQETTNSILSDAGDYEENIHLHTRIPINLVHNTFIECKEAQHEYVTKNVADYLRLRFKNNLEKNE